MLHVMCISSMGDSPQLKVLKEKLKAEFKDKLPETDDFQVGYYHGKQSSKIWLVTEEDHKSMYITTGKSNILLWCDARSSDSVTGQKRKASAADQPL